MDFTSVILILGLVLAIILFSIGTPIFIAFGVGAVILMVWVSGWPLSIISSFYYEAVDSFPLLAMPLFIFAGHLLLRGGGLKYLFKLLDTWAGRLPGGMPSTIVVIAAFFGACSGSCLAAIATIGTIMSPMMIDAGYPRKFTAGLIAGSSELALIIPPSVPMIVIGFLLHISVADFFIAGIIPGLLAALLVMLFVVLICSKRGYGKGITYTWRERFSILWKSLPMLFVPVLIMGGIYGGIFTPTEAAAVVCVYALLIGLFVYRGFNWSGIKGSIMDTVKTTAVVYVIIGTGMMLGKMLGFVGVADSVTQFFVKTNIGQAGFLWSITFILIVLGCILEAVPLTLICAPLFWPAVQAMGIPPLVYGVIFVLCSMIGDITPPVGMGLYLSSSVMKENVVNVMKEAWPYLLCYLLTIGIVIYFYPLATWLPSKMFAAG